MTADITQTVAIPSPKTTLFATSPNDLFEVDTAPGGTAAAPGKPADRDRCHVCHRRAAQAALQSMCPRCAQLRHLRPWRDLRVLVELRHRASRPSSPLAVRCGPATPVTGCATAVSWPTRTGRCAMASPSVSGSPSGRIGGNGSSRSSCTATIPAGAVALLRQLGRLLDANPGHHASATTVPLRRNRRFRRAAVSDMSRVLHRPRSGVPRRRRPFLAQTVQARHQQTYLPRGCFAWAKYRRLLLVYLSTQPVRGVSVPNPG